MSYERAGGHMTTPCPNDGSVRVVLDRDAASVTYKCNFCGLVAREVYDPIREGLQAEWRTDR